MSELTLSTCNACGHPCFPAHLLCARCGGSSFRRTPAPTGIAKRVTVVRRSLVKHDGGPPAIALVRTEVGPVVIARLTGDARAGQAVRLSIEGGAVHAAPV